MNAFFFHYNKPVSMSAGEPRLSVHFRDTCMIVKAIECAVPIKSRNRRTQPRCVMSGRAREVTVKNGIALITA
jgi:hypothetical protein